MGAITTSPAGTDYVGFLDVAGWQFKYDTAKQNGSLLPGALPPDWRKAVDRGVHAIIHRIGNGAALDQSFKLGFDAWLDVKDRLDFGAYYYLQPDNITAAQSIAILQRWLAPYPELTLRTMLDFEHYGVALEPALIGRWLRDFIDIHIAEFGYRPMLYAGWAFANPTTVAGTFHDPFNVHPRYPRGTTRPPVEVAAWAPWIPWDKQPITNSTLGRWDGWQFSSSGFGLEYGIPTDNASSGRIDVNVAPLARYGEMLIPAPAPPPPPPIQEDDMIVLIQDKLLGGAVYFADTLAPCGDELFAKLNGRADVLVVEQDHQETSQAFLAKLPVEAVRSYDDFAERLR